MEGVPVILLTILALAGVPLAMVAAIVILLAAVVIVARRQRRNAVAPAEPAE
jgi:hypothetical protein